MTGIATDPQPARTPIMPVTVIRPASGWSAPRFRDAWRERELLYYFAARDVKVRYAQTMLGTFWAFFQPIGMMLVFTFAFRKLGRVQTDGVPYPIFVFAGLTFWTFFSRAVLSGADSLVSNAALLTKTSLPRLLLPVAAIVSALFDFAVTFVLLLGFASFYGYYPTWRLALIPFVMAVGIAIAVGLSLLLCALNVQRRDVRNMLPMFVQLLLFASPVVYSLYTLGVAWASLMSALNPLVGVVEGFRWAIMETGPHSHIAIFSSLGYAVVLVIVGLIYFGRVERRFADVA
jgi:lipopolysaccharide transport system permease protein